MFARSMVLAIAMALAILLMQAETISAENANPRVIVLVSHSAKPYEDAIEGFKDYLSARGVQAQFSIFSLDTDPAGAEKALEKAKMENVKLILALGTLATSAAGKEVTAIPIIAGLILNADEIKARTNLTGVILEFPLEIQLQWMSRLAPESKSIGVLYNPAQNLHKIEAATKIAQGMGLKLSAQKVESPSDLPDALESLSRKVDALWGIADDLVYTPQTSKQILLFSFRNRIPLIGISGEWVKAGALYALERDYKDLGAQCGEEALKILQGARPASLAFEHPRKVVYSLNLKTAQHMKVDIKESLIQGAQQVFK